MMKCVLYVPNERSARWQLQAYKIQTRYIVLQMNISLKSWIYYRKPIIVC